MAKVVIIDYGSGNLKSALKAIEHAGHEANKGSKVFVSADPKDVSKASHIVLPGVGSFVDCYMGLATIPGMIETLKHEVLEIGKPFLGICVGMQLLADRSFEGGKHAGLSWISGDVVPIRVLSKRIKIPHMGWNNLEFAKQTHPILKNLDEGEHAYFVHSYHFKCSDPLNAYASVRHSEKISAIIGKNNIIGTQFHPEKSQKFGLRLLQNFLSWSP